jgi:chaperonin GroEL (HSP60 family)
VNQTYLKQQVRGFAKKITFGTDARAAMLSGVEQLADAVRFGLGGIGFYVW